VVVSSPRPGCPPNRSLPGAARAGAAVCPPARNLPPARLSWFSCRPGPPRRADRAAGRGEATAGASAPARVPCPVSQQRQSAWFLPCPAGLNPAVVTVTIQASEWGSRLVIRGAAKEGLIKQRAGAKAAKRVAAAIAPAAADRQPAVAAALSRLSPGGRGRR
jgi:hypothetical protein